MCRNVPKMWKTPLNYVHEKINNQHILLIDDIITTGATLTAVGKELMKASNVKISILALGVASDK